jgi:2'-5' RNA ligase
MGFRRRRGGLGIYVIARLGGRLAEEIHEIQRRFDPKLANRNPPHLTLAGSSGMGPIDPATDAAELEARLAPIAGSTPPLVLEPSPPQRFMQTEIIVLPLDPHGPLRALHERIKSSGLSFEEPRFAFTPHVTLNFYRTLDAEQRRELLAWRVTEPVLIDAIECSLSREPQSAIRLLSLPLLGNERGRE